MKSSPSLDITDEITLAAWVYRLGERGTAIGKWYQRGSWSYVLHLPGNGFHLHWEDRTQTNIRGFVLPYLEWAHYAGTYDGSRMRVYVNGELAAERAVPGKRINSTDSPVWIGASGYRDRTPALIDGVEIWNVARTQEQIRQSMRDGLAGDEPGLVAWLPMEEDPPGTGRRTATTARCRGRRPCTRPASPGMNGTRTGPGAVAAPVRLGRCGVIRIRQKGAGRFHARSGPRSGPGLTHAGKLLWFPSLGIRF